MGDAVKEFTALVEVADTLMGPAGCPWDREQTLVSIRAAILEEACEVIEAIDMEDDANLVEELGDLLYVIIFFCKIGEKEGRFSLDEAMRMIREKLIFRHPHVYKGTEVADAGAVLEQWEQLKKEEKKERESVMDGIPKGLPALARGFKMAKKMEKSPFEKLEKPNLPEFETEDELGSLLWSLVKQARAKGLNPETALRKELSSHEEAFREWEKK